MKIKWLIFRVGLFFNTSNQEITIETFRFKDDNEYEI